MKAYTQKALVLTLLLAGAAVGPTILGAVEAGPRFGQVNSDTDKVSGKVEAKSTDSLSVNGHTVQVTHATTITKDGSPIKIGDVNVGDRIAAVTVKGPEGRLLAVSIEVTSISTE